MTAAVLKQRAATQSRVQRLTLEGLLGNYRIPSRTFRAVVAGAVIDLETATRLLPLVAHLTEPGEVPALECQLPHGAAVVMTPATFAELRERFFTHQPN